MILFAVRNRMEEGKQERRRRRTWVRMGKQTLVAGLLASSVLVVVPPLAVVSVIGISLSIPFGLFLASHACTHKLMSKLLPMPATPSYVVRLGDGKKQVDGSHDPIPSIVTAEETTIALHQESSNAVADSENPSAGRNMSPPNNNEVAVNEEKLCKEMNAVRVIVGYEGAPQASCMDELKNLYIVAGVEPPSLLSASCSADEIHDRLRFLMSILGVKSNGS